MIQWRVPVTEFWIFVWRAYLINCVWWLVIERINGQQVIIVIACAACSTNFTNIIVFIYWCSILRHSLGSLPQHRFKFWKATNLKHNSIGCSDFRFKYLSKFWNDIKDYPRISVVSLLKWKHYASLEFSLGFKSLGFFTLWADFLFYPKV